MSTTILIYSLLFFCFLKDNCLCLGMQEHLAQSFFNMLIDGVEYLHKKGVSHRDIVNNYESKKKFPLNTMYCVFDFEIPQNNCLYQLSLSLLLSKENFCTPFFKKALSIWEM